MEVPHEAAQRSLHIRRVLDEESHQPEHVQSALLAYEQSKWAQLVNSAQRAIRRLRSLNVICLFGSSSNPMSKPAFARTCAGSAPRLRITAGRADRTPTRMGGSHGGTAAAFNRRGAKRSTLEST